MTAPNRLGRAAAAAATVVLGIVVLGPAVLSRGYVLAGDMTFVPDQPWKSAWLGLDGSVPRAVPADAVVSLLGTVVPGDWLQKVVLLGILALAGIGMLRLAGRVGELSVPARFGAAVLYLWNPYVFERLAIGHWGLLVGYAALPWVVAATLDLRTARAGVAREAGRLGLLLAVAAVGSPTGGLLTGLVAVVLVADRDRPRRALGVAGAVLLANLPWLVPGLVNDLGTSDGSGVAAFAAGSDTPFGPWVSLLTFGGIWKRAAAPGEREAGLLVLVALALVVLSLVAFARACRRSRTGVPLARLLGLAVLALVVAGLPAMGPGERLATDVVDLVPGAGLWRDSQKWLVPFVLVACLGFALLLDAAARRMRAQGVPAGAATLMLALAPVVLLPSLAWGLSGRLVPVHYPDEWQAVRSVLEHQPAGQRRTAVLPWSAYQRLPWNDGRAALDPAIRFFPGQVVVSTDLTVARGVTVAGEDRAAARIGRAIAAHQSLGPVLAGAGVRYLLVERTAPSAVEVALPEATVLHDGPDLLLLDLGGGGRLERSPRGGLILAADLLSLLGVLAAAFLFIRRKPDAASGSMQSGSTVNGDVADKR
jgi:hypothetical protein